jgi:hypothetical protein
MMTHTQATEIINNPKATAEELIQLSQWIPAQVVKHPNCPSDLFWRLMVNHPVEAISSTVGQLYSLEDPQRWMGYIQKHATNWIGRLMNPHGEAYHYAALQVGRYAAPMMLADILFEGGGRYMHSVVAPPIENSLQMREQLATKQTPEAYQAFTKAREAVTQSTIGPQISPRASGLARVFSVEPASLFILDCISLLRLIFPTEDAQIKFTIFTIVSQSLLERSAL